MLFCYALTWAATPCCQRVSRICRISLLSLSKGGQLQPAAEAPLHPAPCGEGCPDVKRLETFQQMSRAGKLAVHLYSSKEGPRSTPHLGWHPTSHRKGSIVMSGEEDFPVYPMSLMNL